MSNQLETNKQSRANAFGGGAVPYSPLREMLGYDPFRRFSPNFDPQIDVVRNDDGFYVEIPAAGFTAEQIEIVIKDSILSIVGKNEKRSFTRTIYVPEDIDATSIGAAVDNGMLSLTLKRHPEAQPRRIEVMSAAKEAASTARQKK